MMPFILLLTLLSLAIALVFLAARAKATCRVTPKGFSVQRLQNPAAVGCRIEPKPPWVHEEVIRLKALMSEHGCRKIAVTFNVLHGSRRKMTVGKSFVAGVVRGNKAEIRKKRRELKHRVPRAIPKNTIWALDLTTVDDSPVLGVVDHGTRACLELSKLPDKTMLTILRSVIDLIERFGRPKVLRTDNEGMFASPFFGLIIKMLGARHQRTMPKAPWQNGRIERFFGTLKAALRLKPGGPIDQEELRAFR
ncbi:MAG: hypothetical protein AAFY88_31150, partial [Acidobacteriota bacterium]